MQVIAKTEIGYLINATKEEIEAIMESVSKPISDKNPIEIGDKIPAYDYSAMIKQCKAFSGTYDFRKFKEAIESLSTTGRNIIAVVETLKFETR